MRVQLVAVVAGQPNATALVERSDSDSSAILISKKWARLRRLCGITGIRYRKHELLVLADSEY